MSVIIDRRLNPRDKAIKNRQKFIQRSREQIKKYVRDAIDNDSISDIEKGKIRVKVKGINEPTFQKDRTTGDKKYVLPGNEEYVVGDSEKKPQQQSGKKGSGDPSDDGQGEDGFEFVLSSDEYLDFIFEDLELPHLIKKQMKDMTKVKPHRAGFTNQGNPSQLDIIRSLKNSLGRRIGLNRPKNDRIEEIEQLLKKEHTPASRTALEKELMELKRRQKAIPWLDPFDVRYRNFNMVPQPITQAVMICIMDISGSMGEYEKNIAKRFFFLLHMFLNRKYEKVQIVFIRHHTSAKEVDEEEFFHSKETGGTIVSSGLKLAKEIIDTRYNVNDWNIYVAQSSDGDNTMSDNIETDKVLRIIMPIIQYFAYVEIMNEDPTPYNYFGKISLLSTLYKKIKKDFTHLAICNIDGLGNIWTVFKKLFQKETS